MYVQHFNHRHNIVKMQTKSQNSSHNENRETILSIFEIVVSTLYRAVKLPMINRIRLLLLTFVMIKKENASIQN